MKEKALPQGLRRKQRGELSKSWVVSSPPSKARVRGGFEGKAKRSERGRGAGRWGDCFIERLLPLRLGLWAARRVRRVARRGGMLAAVGYHRAGFYCGGARGEEGRNGRSKRDGVAAAPAGRGNNGLWQLTIGGQCSGISGS
jgi:hypothetical protein